MKQKKLVVVVLALLVVLLLPVAALAATSIKFSGKFASVALFNQEDCLYTDIGIFAAESVSKNKGKPSKGPSLYIRMIRADICEFEIFLEVSETVQLDSSAFTIDSQLKSARLNTTLELYNYATGSPLSLNVDLTWTGIGELLKGTVKYTNRSPGCKISGKFSDIYREAQVSGTISDGTTDFMSELAPYYVQLFSTKNSTLTVGCDG